MKYLLIFTLLFSSVVMAEDTCSRVATINYQEVLIDTNSAQKGEGLRFYLEKDAEAKYFLDRYQEGNRSKWQNAVLGTIGTTLIVSGLVTTNGNTSQSFLIGGAAIIAVNFLVAKTLEHKNEFNLQHAVEEYNKRNLPRIQLVPQIPTSSHSGSSLMINLQKDY